MSTAHVAPLRPVTQDEVHRFRNDGVVALRSILPAALVTELAHAADRLTATDTTNLTELGAAVTQPIHDPSVAGPGPTGQFRAGTDHWRRDPTFRRFATRSPLPRIVADLLRSARVWLYEDSLLVKEPLTREVTALHQDLGYFHVDGSQICTTWCPLDPVDATTGALMFVRGSHRWERDYRPNWFVSDEPMPGTAGEVAPREVPEADLLRFDLEPGDLTVHHARTLHGAGANRSTTRTRRAVSIRYCGDDARHRRREGAPEKPHHAGKHDGDLLTDEACPIVWGPGTRP